jgi:hypothetical protein
MLKVISGCISLALLSGVFLWAESPEASRSAAQKLERISAEMLNAGETVQLSQNELNSYLKYDYAGEIPEGVRDLEVTLIKDYGIAEAIVDFEKLSAVKSSPFATFGARLFRGERKMKARCRFVSADGQGKVEVDTVELDGQPLPDFLVEFLVASTVQETLKDFEPGKPFPLENNLRQIRLESANVVVVSY